MRAITYSLVQRGVEAKKELARKSDATHEDLAQGAQFIHESLLPPAGPP
jgi:hypothetical protein